jgi:hypothetical protein
VIANLCIFDQINVKTRSKNIVASRIGIFILSTAENLSATKLKKAHYVFKNISHQIVELT